MIPRSSADSYCTTTVECQGLGENTDRQDTGESEVKRWACEGTPLHHIAFLRQTGHDVRRNSHANAPRQGKVGRLWCDKAGTGVWAVGVTPTTNDTRTIDQPQNRSIFKHLFSVVADGKIAGHTDPLLKNAGSCETNHAIVCKE